MKRTAGNPCSKQLFARSPKRSLLKAGKRQATPSAKKIARVPSDGKSLVKVTAAP